MAGPSGMDAPAPPAQYLSDAFRVISALSHGDPGRAARISDGMGMEEFGRLRLLARQLDDLTEEQWCARRRAELAGVVE
jgi:hypothetical protein